MIDPFLTNEKGVKSGPKVSEKRKRKKKRGSAYQNEREGDDLFVFASAEFRIIQEDWIIIFIKLGHFLNHIVVSGEQLGVCGYNI